LTFNAKKDAARNENLVQRPFFVPLPPHMRSPLLTCPRSKSTGRSWLGNRSYGKTSQEHERQRCV